MPMMHAFSAAGGSIFTTKMMLVKNATTMTLIGKTSHPLNIYPATTKAVMNSSITFLFSTTKLTTTGHSFIAISYIQVLYL